MLKFSILSILLMLLTSRETKQSLHNFNASHELLKYSGRYEFLTDSTKALISSGAYVQFNVQGDSLNIYLQTASSARNYYVITVNGTYRKRYKIEGDSIQKIGLKLPASNQNTIGIYKATEAFNDRIIFHGIDAEALLPLGEKSLKVEFIGDSITCAALSDTSDMPCNEGEYQDHHNAYLSYGARIATLLNADFMLSSVSGIGMYRNWNDEHLEEPVMPQVYGNLYLNTDMSKPYDYSFHPDITTICLGTNDLSEGDGLKPRLPFNPEEYTEHYIRFIETIYAHSPDTKIILLNSPMIQGDKNETLVVCLKKVQTYFKTDKNKEITLFEFDHLYVNGCNYHPSTEENNMMAEQLLPTFNTLLNKE
ncbi:SGNH/GDSL hydrolase family protein [Gelidibacter mesophilus]|uniref:SGNH/GDSL hydrolase family protein n=1 Tax=Gelidibacter mesophilus TaxID=169050 RepID=UPI000A01C438|nr:SGNH/GDSL hydrolase family protein [Gelidibacter mesophilus]